MEIHVVEMATAQCRIPKGDTLLKPYVDPLGSSFKLAEVKRRGWDSSSPKPLKRLSIQATNQPVPQNLKTVSYQILVGWVMYFFPQLFQ